MHVISIHDYFWSIRKKLTNETENWSTTTVRGTVTNWPTTTASRVEPERKKTKWKWWKPKNSSMKSSESSTSSTQSCTTNCPLCTTLGCCFWLQTCNHTLLPNNYFTANRLKYVFCSVPQKLIYLLFCYVLLHLAIRICNIMDMAIL